MTDYPIGSTAKVYYDGDGNPTTLYRLIRDEPDWARSRIIEGEKAIAENAKLQEEIAALKSAPLFDALANKQEARIAALEKVAEAAISLVEDKRRDTLHNPLLDNLEEALRLAGYLKEVEG